MITKIPEHRITPKTVYEKRRQLIGAVATAASGMAMGSWLSPIATAQSEPPKTPQGLSAQQNPSHFLLDKTTPYRNAVSYNNFFEFGTNKSDPAAYAHRLQTSPWSVRIEGLVAKPKTFDLEQLLKLAALEERIYRLRCVEGWSMVIPWIGYPLNQLIRQAQPLGSARYVEFTSLANADQMPGISRPILDWPYREGLRLDEAIHPLTLLTFGLYGEVLPKQNGAPVRVVIPWKYGFKSAKSIVRIRLLEHPPQTSWNVAVPREYGFYANVNPAVNHPRWSQASERRIGDEGGIFAPKRKTLPFNGYADQVASLYSGMDLEKYF